MIETSYINTTTRDSWNITNLEYKDCPLTALSRVTIKILSHSLNNLKVIHSEGGYERDWRGLATLSEQRGLCTDYSMTNDPFDRVLKLWCENKPETATFGNLILYLGIIDRWHIIEDVHKNLLKDYQDYQVANVQQSAAETIPSNIEKFKNNESVKNKENNTSSLPLNSSIDMNRENTDYDFKAKILTSNDVQCYQHDLPLEQYDAFILYADKDYKYALEILAKLQNNRLYNFTFCLKDDLLFGIPFEHIALMELIRERCKFLIAILTKEFIKSPENRFFVNYAQALQIKQEIRKVLPLLYEDDIEIPANLTMFSRMRYNPYRTDLYWSKLADSMQLLRFNERVIPSPSTTQYITNNRRLQAVDQQRNLAIEATNRLALPSPSSSPSPQSEKLTRKKKPITKAKHLKTKSCVKTSLYYANQTDSVSLKSRDSHSSSSNRSKSFLRRLICCRR